MTLYFDNPVLRDRFIDLCKRMNAHGESRTDPTRYHRYIVRVEIDGKDKDALTAEWSKETAERRG